MNEPLKQIIESHPFFSGMKPEHLQVIEQRATKASFVPGELLFVECEPANRFYVIINGRVSLEAHELADGTVPLQTLGSGEVLGWSWLFAPFVWHFRAKAIDRVEVLSLDAPHLLNCAERDHDFGYELMKRLTQVVIQRLQTTRKELLKHKFEFVHPANQRTAA